MDAELLDQVRHGLIFYIILVCSVGIHEWAHAKMADRLGDPLPRSMGRVTLNPLAHIDMIGTVLFPLLIIFLPMFFSGASHMALIGWGKPVLISLPNRKTRTRDDLLITAAGPLSNLLLCLIVATVASFFIGSHPGTVPLVQNIILVNAALFVFNLIPIPPLDGSHFLRYAIGMKEETYQWLAQWGFLILLVLINVGPFRHLLSMGIYSVATLANGLMMALFSTTL